MLHCTKHSPTPDPLAPRWPAPPPPSPPARPPPAHTYTEAPAHHLPPPPHPQPTPQGGVGISLSVWDTSLAFVNSHLAAHQDKSRARNNNYRSAASEADEAGKGRQHILRRDRLAGPHTALALWGLLQPLHRSAHARHPPPTRHVLLPPHPVEPPTAPTAVLSGFQTRSLFSKPRIATQGHHPRPQAQRPLRSRSGPGRGRRWRGLV